MNENARKWVVALRSGKYEQAKNALRDGNGFCCLGVACDIYMKDTGDGEWDGSDYFHSACLSDCSGTGLPCIVMEWIGIVSNDGSYTEQGEEWNLSLANHNDNDKPFSYIADIIESEPDGLFHE